MASYVESLSSNKYIPNIIFLFKGEYYGMRQPNSGLVLDADKVGIVAGLTVNPTSIDPFRASSTINSYSWKLLDKNRMISALFNGETKYFQGEPVDIFIGRIGLTPETEMAFSEYYQLPTTYVNKVTKIDNGYTFQSVEAKDRIDTGAFNQQTLLAVDILSVTTVITVQSVDDLPTNGTIKIEDEFISYVGISGLNLQNCVRGERTSVPADHPLGATVFLVAEVQVNPMDLLLQLLISPGGGGIYDVLPDGAGIDQSLIDIDDFETTRDEFFSSYTFDFAIFGVESLKQFIENEILFPLGLRLRSNNNSKIGLAKLDRSIFEIDSPTIDDTNTVKPPDFFVDDTKIRNRVRIQWDYFETSSMYLKQTEYTDAQSISDFGVSDWTTFKLKGVKDSLGGQEIVDNIALLFLNRFSQPRPQIKASTLINASYNNIGDKVNVASSYIPNDAGVLNFASTLEIIQKSLNWETGDCTFQLAFTSFTGVRQCYIAPTATVVSHSGQSQFTLGAGVGDNWRKGWKVRLFNNVTGVWESDPVNEILSVVGDVVNFVDPWATTIVDSTHRLTFCDYDEATDQQKRFCFISDDGLPFGDGKPSYQISFG